MYIDITKHVRIWKVKERMVREKFPLCGITYCTCKTWSVIGTLLKLFFEPIAKARFAEANVVPKVLGIPRRIFILVRVLLV
jgi:hypothetical protein